GQGRQMGADGLRGVGALGGVLRADLARYVERQERIALAEQVDVTGAELAPQRVDEDELAFPAGAVLDALRALGSRPSCELGVKLLDRRETFLGGRVGGRQDRCGCCRARERSEALHRLAT